MLKILLSHNYLLLQRLCYSTSARNSSSEFKKSNFDSKKVKTNKFFKKSGFQQKDFGPKKVHLSFRQLLKKFTLKKKQRAFS